MFRRQGRKGGYEASKKLNIKEADSIQDNIVDENMDRIDDVVRDRKQYSKDDMTIRDFFANLR
jgi:hypothetical protein